MALILDRSSRSFTAGGSPLAIDFSGITPDRLAGLAFDEIARLPVMADGRRCDLADVCRLRGSLDDGRLECHGDFSRGHWLGAGMRWGEITTEGSVGRHAGEAMTGGRLSIRGDAGDWLAAELAGGTVHVWGNAGDNAAAALPGSRHGVGGGMVIIEGRAGSLAGARMRRGILAIGGGCGTAAAFELRAGTVLIIGPVGPEPALGMRRGSLIAASLEPRIPPLFRRGAEWRPAFIPLLAKALQRAGFRAITAIGDAFGRPWRQWHGDPLEGCRGELFHPAGPFEAFS